MSKFYEMLRELGVNTQKLRIMADDTGYKYLINEYIPSQGGSDMKAFIELGFSPYNYILWKLQSNGFLKEPLSSGVKNRIIEVFGGYPSKGDT